MSDWRLEPAGGTKPMGVEQLRAVTDVLVMTQADKDVWSGFADWLLNDPEWGVSRLPEERREEVRRQLGRAGETPLEAGCACCGWANIDRAGFQKAALAKLSELMR